MCVCVTLLLLYSRVRFGRSSTAFALARVFFCCEVGDIEKRRDNEGGREKKLERMDWCNRRVHYIKKRQKKKKKKRPRREKTKRSVNGREEKKREVRRDWLVHFDNWNEDDKEMLSPVRRGEKKRERERARWKETLFAFEREKREKKMCIYRIRSTARPTQEISLHSFSRNSSKLVSSRLHIYIYNIDDKMKKRRCVQRVI